jgi:hypothetical protein
MRRSCREETEPQVVDMVGSMRVEQSVGGITGEQGRFFMVRVQVKDDFKCVVGGKRYAFRKNEVRVIPNDVFAVLRRNNVVY